MKSVSMELADASTSFVASGVTRATRQWHVGWHQQRHVCNDVERTQSVEMTL